MTPSYSTLNAYLNHYAEAIPQGEAVVFGDLRLTYRALKAQVDNLVKVLLSYDIKPGDRVAVLSTPRPEYWVLLLAVTRIGAVWVGLNAKSTQRELLHVVSDSEPKLLFSLVAFEGRDFSDDAKFLQENCQSINLVVFFGGDMACEQSLDSLTTIAKIKSTDQELLPSSFCPANKPAIIVYTSGTTGKPKGAVISNKALAQGAYYQTQHFSVDSPRLICCFPINHVACVADICATTLVAGGTLIFQERFDAKQSLMTMASESVSIWAGVPTMFQMQLEEPIFDACDLSAVELALWGGASLPKEYIEKLHDKEFRLMTAYGMTETAANTLFTDANASLETLSDTVGKADANYLFRIADGNNSPCEIGQDGELQFKSDYLFSGYYRQPIATENAFTDDGWFHTGDIGRVQDDGNVVIVGRLSEMYKSGGYNVYPREIEIVLESIPGIEMAIVVAVDDEKFQEVGAAFFQVSHHAKLSIPDVKQKCQEYLANYKVPKHFFQVKDLPLLNNGKVNKKALKDFYQSSKNINN